MKRVEKHSSSMEFNISGLRIRMLAVVARCSFLENCELKGSPVRSSDSLPGTMYLCKTVKSRETENKDRAQTLHWLHAFISHKSSTLQEGVMSKAL